MAKRTKIYAIEIPITEKELERMRKAAILRPTGFAWESIRDFCFGKGEPYGHSRFQNDINHLKIRELKEDG